MGSGVAIVHGLEVLTEHLATVDGLEVQAREQEVLVADQETVCEAVGAGAGAGVGAGESEHGMEHCEHNAVEVEEQAVVEVEEQVDGYDLGIGQEERLLGFGD